MTITVQRGPAAQIPDTNLRDDEFDISFRVVTMYQVGTDTLVTRFDVLMNAVPGQGGSLLRGGDQFNAAFQTTAPGTADLLTPGKGVEGAYSFKASAQDLSQVLRGLADKIDETVK